MIPVGLYCGALVEIDKLGLANAKIMDLYKTFTLDNEMLLLLTTSCYNGKEALRIMLKYTTGAVV